MQNAHNSEENVEKIHRKDIMLPTINAITLKMKKYKKNGKHDFWFKLIMHIFYH